MKRPINARFESVDKRPMFRSAFRTRRCLVLCDGYYEWQVRPTGPKQPYYFHRPEGVQFALAGLWERNERLSETPLETFCVLTKAASPIVEHIHDRMPLLLPQAVYAAWLNPSACDAETLNRLAGSAKDDWIVQPVSRFVNSPANNSSRCREPLDLRKER
jgi:putative SOS response-associated peptidase YedK